jgi:hypothetical protein
MLLPCLSYEVVCCKSHAVYAQFYSTNPVTVDFIRNGITVNTQQYPPIFHFGFIIKKDDWVTGYTMPIEFKYSSWLMQFKPQTIEIERNDYDTVAQRKQIYLVLPSVNFHCILVVT